MSERILDKLNNPKEIQTLSVAQLYQLAQELRDTIIDTVSQTGGHLAPSLGTVELTLAMYSIFDPGVDKIVWDVGHQSYSHKLLTGRRDRFYTLRQKGGITGFPKLSESPYDAFGVGHASTSISAALGMAYSRDIKGQKYNVIAIIGDGALTGGEAFEGMNNAGDSGKHLIIVLNDNEMSIDKNVGALSEYLSQLRIHPKYAQTKRDVEEILKNIPRIGSSVFRTVELIKDGVSAALSPGGYFEEMGFTYFGPTDGHNIEILQQTFRQAMETEGPVLIHIRTTKGRGFEPAEQAPNKFHGIGRFDPESGEVEKNNSVPASYTKVFSDAIVDMGGKYHDIVAITAAMPSGTGLKAFGAAYPNRFFDVGIAEEHAVTMAAGMAASGSHPFVALYSTFAQRAYDQMLHDVCLQNLPVTLCLDRGGLVGADGPTHHGVFDYSYLRHIPNMVVMAPKDENELRNMMKTAYLHPGPASIRYPRGAGLGVELDETLHDIPVGKGEIIFDTGYRVGILAVGTMVNNSLEAAEMLSAQGIDTTLANMRFIKPLDGELIERLASKCELLVTVEENVLAGGFGSAVLEYLCDKEIHISVVRIGIEDAFIEQGTVKELYDLCGLLPKQIVERIIDRIEHKVL